jgi:hypothetical protein
MEKRGITREMIQGHVERLKVKAIAGNLGTTPK